MLLRSKRLSHLSACVAAAALAAMTLIPATAATAAPGDLAHGVVTVDANKNGAIDATGAAGTSDHGVAGVVVNALAADGSVVGTTTTATDGSWAITEASLSGPATKIEIVTDGANGNVYATYPTPNGVNAFTRSGAANTATADVSGTDVELNALVYPTWSLDLALAADPDGLDGLAIRTGTGPFDADDSEPGNDAGMANARIRSSDIMSFNWSLTASSEDALAQSFGDSVFEQTINLDPGAVANFAAMPAVCDVAKSSIVAQPSGSAITAAVIPPAGTTSITLTCNLGAMGEDRAGILLPTLVQPLGTSENGATFTTTARAYAVDANGTATAQPASGVDSPSVEITSAPRFDVEKLPGSWSMTTVLIDGQAVTGIRYWYTVQVSTDRKVGVEGFQQPLTLEESLWGTRSVDGPGGEAAGTGVDGLKWYIDRCEPSMVAGSQSVATLVYGKPGANGAAATSANSVRNSGTCTFSRSGTTETENYTLTLSGIDASGASYPTQTAGGQSLAAGPYYVASYRVGVFIPSSELDRLQGAPADGVGEMSVFNRVGDFDPVGVSGASNFGSGTEPGYCEPGPGSDGSTNCSAMEDARTSNNVAGPTTIRVSPGSWAKYILDVKRPWSASEWVLPNMGGAHDGAAQVQPGQTFTSTIRVANTGLAMDSAEMCDVFDSTVLKLAPLAQSTSLPATDGGSGYANDQYSAVLAMRNAAWLTPAEQRARQDEWVTKYGHVDLDGDDPNTGVFDSATNRFEGDWSNQREATNGANNACANASMTWYDSPEDVPGGVDGVNAVWISTAEGVTIPSGGYDYWILGLEQRDTYNGGPHDGVSIQSGTVAANFGAVKTSNFSQNWSRADYIPGAGETAGTHRAGENGSVQGDRWTVTRAQMRLQKRTIAGEVGGVSATGVADYGTTGSAVAGKPVIWELNATLTANSDPAAEVNNVRITDVLPEYVTLDEAATSALNPGVPAPTVTVNGDGTTTVVWNLGTRVPNEELPTIKVATVTDALAPNNSFVVNNAKIEAAGIVPVSAHRDDHTIRLEQTGELQLKKSVDKTLDLQNDEQTYTLQVKNFSDTLAIQKPTIIDVLPYNGDATSAANVNRSPGSDFTGQNRLKAAPESFEFDGSTSVGGTFYYTTVAPANVPQNLTADTDPSIWSTTFTPNATAIKFVADANLSTANTGSKSGLAITFTTTQSGNSAGDLYSNRFTAFSDTLKNGNRFQMLTSNLVSVRIAGFSVGDLVWFDLNGDGTFTEGTDRVAPEGVKVEVYDAADERVGQATTDADGRWVVSKLPRGEYYALIPASEFAEGAKLADAVAAPGAESDPNTDYNEGEDHHAISTSAGVRSAGLLTLQADAEADPIEGQEPLSDNVKGLGLPPMTGDGFTNLTLDLALVPGAKLNVAKTVDGEAADFGTGPFTIEVTCALAGETAEGYPKTITVQGGETEELIAPLGSKCSAVETGTGAATRVDVSAPDGVTLESEEEPASIEITNIFDAGSFQIMKEITGAGTSFTNGTYSFDVACTFNGSTDPVFQQTVTLTGTELPLESEAIEGLPVGAECVITEVDNGGADETPAPIQIVIDNDPETVQLAGFVNEYSAGTIELTKSLDGDAASDPFVKNLEYELAATCQLERDGQLVDVYGGTVKVKAGEMVAPELNGRPVLLPLGTHCFGEELVTQGAAHATVDFDSYDHAAVVEKGDLQHPQTLTLTATNTFENAELTVSKKVVGPAGNNTRYQFEVSCTYPVMNADGVVEEIDYPLDSEDARFSLQDGESRTITVLAGVSCRATEVDVPKAAEVSYADSDPSTPGSASDGVLADLHGADNTVLVTNTFEKDPETPTGPGPGAPTLPAPFDGLVSTGGAALTAGIWSALGLLVTGGILLTRRRKEHEASRHS